MSSSQEQIPRSVAKDQKSKDKIQKETLKQSMNIHMKGEQSKKYLRNELSQLTEGREKG